MAASEYIFMKPKVQLLLLFCVVALSVRAQKDTSSVRKLGDAAPPLRVRDWIKGTPVNNFEKRRVYVIDFWATWCAPCIASMPHLSALARKYKGKVIFSAVSVFEDRGTRGATPEKLKAFVDGMGNKMDFNVASEDTNFTVQDWLRAYHQDYIPTAFVVDGQGKVAWTGYPFVLDTALKKILNNTWDVQAESSKRRYADSSQNYLENLDDTLASKVRRFQGKYNDTNDLGFPDSALLIIDDMVKKEPKLKYAPWASSYTFKALLITDPHKAYEFGKQAMGASPDGGYACGSIIGDIRDGLRKLTMPKEIYLLGAACYQVKINRSPPYYAADEMAKQYQEMAQWYRLGGDKLKAIAAEKKAIKLWEKDYKNSLH